MLEQSGSIDQPTSGDVPTRGLGHEAHHGGKDDRDDGSHEGQPPPVDVRADQETDEDTWARRDGKWLSGGVDDG